MEMVEQPKRSCDVISSVIFTQWNIEICMGFHHKTVANYNNNHLRLYHQRERWSWQNRTYHKHCNRNSPCNNVDASTNIRVSVGKNFSITFIRRRRWQVMHEYVSVEVGGMSWQKAIIN